MNTLKRLVSLEEKRVSTLMISMMGTLLFALLMYWRRGDVSASLVNILEALIAGVVGVSFASVINTLAKDKAKPEIQPEENSL